MTKLEQARKGKAIMHITYTIRYQYGTYSGTRTITLSDDDERDPRAVMWAQMQRAGELTLAMAYRSAEIIGREERKEEGQ